MLFDRLFKKDSFEIEAENILLSGTTHPPYGEHSFIVYRNENDNRKNIQNNIRVNTCYSEVRPGIYKCHAHYDGDLCNTIAELQEMPMEKIERAAYNIWMSGAR